MPRLRYGLSDASRLRGLLRRFEDSLLAMTTGGNGQKGAILNKVGATPCGRPTHQCLAPQVREEVGFRDDSKDL